MLPAENLLTLGSESLTLRGGLRPGEHGVPLAGCLEAPPWGGQPCSAAPPGPALGWGPRLPSDTRVPCSGVWSPSLRVSALLCTLTPLHRRRFMSHPEGP